MADFYLILDPLISFRWTASMSATLLASSGTCFISWHSIRQMVSIFNSDLASETRYQITYVIYHNSSRTSIVCIGIERTVYIKLDETYGRSMPLNRNRASRGVGEGTIS
uniref:Uncharacterized protein n=1 Tax=Solanum lycopersicum TaxID=4081 RepID=A0A3Q7FK10_SOLLC